MRGLATVTPPAAPALVQSVALWRRGSASKTVPLVQSHAVPKPDALLSAVVVSGGKQYRVAPGDKILVDRLTAEPGTSLKLDRVLLLRNGDDITVGSPGVDGLDVEVKVLQHRRGPRLESLRYKSKKRVRVHHGGRADLTALEIIAVGGFTGETKKEKAADDKPKAKAPVRPRAKAAVKAEAAAPAAEDKPVKRAPRKREAK
jgi:large subunit ribosomal protein L21